MSRHFRRPSRRTNHSAEAIDFIISALFAVVAVMAALMLANVFQTMPTAIDPMTSVEARYER